MESLSASRETQQRVICALSESKGVSPTVGVAILDLETAEVILSEIVDNQIYVRTLQKLHANQPSTILVLDEVSAAQQKLTPLLEVTADELEAKIVPLERRFWNQSEGLHYATNLAIDSQRVMREVFSDDRYFVAVSFCALVKYVESSLNITYTRNSLRLRYEAPEGSVAIDPGSMRALELVENSQRRGSKECLFGLLNNTSTPMGARLLRSNILQPLIDYQTIRLRQQALEELTSNEHMFFALRKELQKSPDMEKLLTIMIKRPARNALFVTEKLCNVLIQLKSTLKIVSQLYECLEAAQSGLLLSVRESFEPHVTQESCCLINDVLNDDVEVASSPLELRNQRLYSVRSGLNGLLDISRQAYRESVDDIHCYVKDLSTQYSLALQMRFDATRQYVLRLPLDFDIHDMPSLFINPTRKNGRIECGTLDMLKRNQNITDAYTQCLALSENMLRDLNDQLCMQIAPLLKISESLALLDMLCSFAKLIASAVGQYTCPSFAKYFAIKNCRHPIKEKQERSAFVPNDIYATLTSRLQLVQGYNMSGKSTYIKMIPIVSIMAQIGCFVPAQHATVPITRQIFTRIAVDDNDDASVSSFSLEMREIATIMRNATPGSIVIVDELGRGTSNRDGLSIATAIAEALLKLKSFVWFATHFHDLIGAVSRLTGSVCLHLQAKKSDGINEALNMEYRVDVGPQMDLSYGIALARTLPFPANFTETAARGFDRFHDTSASRQSPAESLSVNRKRRIVLDLREQLEQLRNCSIDKEHKRAWLSKLRDEFLRQMMRSDAIQRIFETNSAPSRAPGSPAPVLGGNKVYPYFDGVTVACSTPGFGRQTPVIIRAVSPDDSMLSDAACVTPSTICSDPFTIV